MNKLTLVFTVACGLGVSSLALAGDEPSCCAGRQDAGPSPKDCTADFSRHNSRAALTRIDSSSREATQVSSKGKKEARSVARTTVRESGDKMTVVYNSRGGSVRSDTVSVIR